jgi:hypothetical protein
MNSYMEYLENKVDVWIQNNSKLKKGKISENRIKQQAIKKNVGNIGNANTMGNDTHS